MFTRENLAQRLNQLSIADLSEALLCFLLRKAVKWLYFFEWCCRILLQIFRLLFVYLIEGLDYELLQFLILEGFVANSELID